MTVPPPPGWYPDPEGVAGTVRWWSGSTWSDVVTPAGPGVAVGGPPPGPWAAQPPPGAPPPGARGAGPGRTAWLVGLGLVGLVLVVVAALLAGTGGSGPDAAPATPSTGSAPAQPPNAFPPGTVRIVDQAAGIAYPYLGEGWREYDLAPRAETTTVAGQYFVTQEDPPSGGLYLAECTSGPVADGYGWAGPDSLRRTALALAESQRGNYYPIPNDKRVLRDEARTVDGRAAHLHEFQLSWDVEGYDASGERVALLLVDVGRPVPAMLVVSVPNTHAELYGVIDRVVGGVEVLG